MSKADEARKRAQEEIARAEREDRLEALLPTDPQGLRVRTYAHKDHVSVRMGEDFRTTRTLEQALALLALFGTPSEVEYRKDGSLSRKPFELYSRGELDRLQLERVSVVSIEVDSASGDPRLALEAWFRIGEEWCEVSIPFQVSSLLSAVPTWERDKLNRKTGRLLWRGIGEDSRVTWWSPENCFKGTYLFANLESFREWTDMKARERAEG